jgi:hypothetical protein
MATVAVRAAIDEVLGKSSPIVECLEPTLIIRESSGPAPSPRQEPNGIEATAAGEVVPA